MLQFIPDWMKSSSRQANVIVKAQWPVYTEPATFYTKKEEKLIAHLFRWETHESVLALSKRCPQKVNKFYKLFKNKVAHASLLIINVSLLFKKRVIWAH